MCDNSFTITLLMFHGGPKHILQNCQNKALSVMEHVCILSAFHDTGADLGGGCRGCAPPPPTGTTGILPKKTMWFTGVEVEQETSAPPPKKNPGSAPVTYKVIGA